MGRRIWPITALSAILVVAFALLLISVLSVPVTKSITLCTYGGIQFGVFGYCDTKTNTCSSVRIGYGDVTSVDGFSLPSNARHTLASLLIVHVVAAGLTLILLLFTLIAHFPRAGSSSRYLLFILIFSLPCFLVSLLAFLVDILLFVPHLDWGGWIVLASTVLIAIFGVFLCVLRRTTSSRKSVQRNSFDNPELLSLGQYDNAFSGGVSYKPTANSGDLIFANSVDGYKSLNHSLPPFNETKYDTNVSSYPSENDEAVPLTGSSHQRPVSGFIDAAVNDPYSDQRYLPSRREEINAPQDDFIGYNRNESASNLIPPVDNPQQPYIDYPDYSANQPQYANYPQTYDDHPPTQDYTTNYPVAQNINEINRPPSSNVSIIPAGTYPSEYHTSRNDNQHSDILRQERYSPQQDDTAYDQYSPSTVPSYYSPQPPLDMQNTQLQNYPNTGRDQNFPVQYMNNHSTIDEVSEPPFNFVEQNYPEAPAFTKNQNHQNTMADQASSNDITPTHILHSQKSYTSGDMNHRSNNNSKVSINQQQGSVYPPDRQDLLLQSNPDFQISDKLQTGRKQRNQKIPAASYMKDLGDSGPYGISKMNF